MLVFKVRENRSTWRKTSWCREGNQVKLNPHDAESGNRTRATLVGGVSALTTVPSLQKKKMLLCGDWSSLILFENGLELAHRCCTRFGRPAPNSQTAKELTDPSLGPKVAQKTGLLLLRRAT